MYCGQLGKDLIRNIIKANIHSSVLYVTIHCYVDDLNELRYKITSLVLQYCVENMQDGWKEWVKIAAWLYVHVCIHNRFV